MIDKATILTVAAVAVDISSEDHDLTATLPPCARRIYVGTGGTVKVKRFGAATVFTYKNVPDGCYLDGAFTHVVKSGTTAADMIAEQ